MRAPKWSGNARALARVQLCHRHLDSRTRKLLPRATIKVACAYLQSCERERVPRLELRRQRLPIRAAGGSTRTLARLFPRASPLGERCSVVDTVPKATRTPPRVPIRVRAEKSPLSSVSPRGNGEWRGAPDGEELRAVSCVWSHRPCIELLYRSYSQRF